MRIERLEKQLERRGDAVRSLQAAMLSRVLLRRQRACVQQVRTVTVPLAVYLPPLLFFLALSP